jgi:phosphatidylglycerophosphate synthase
MFGIAFMVFYNDTATTEIYTIGFVLLVAAAVMTIWSMFFYLKAAWPFIMADEKEGSKG